MKESDITQPVIDKCKQIAKLWGMEIYEGCWCILRWQEPFLIVDELLAQWADEQGAIPIPSISDCLEKLGERQKFMPDYYNKKDFDRSLLNIFKYYIKGELTVEKVHCWLLTALLEVLKNG